MKEIAIYLRLSKADKERTRESQSIQNQRALLYKAIREDASFGEYPITAYIDDGYSGLQQDRPALCAMMQKIRQKKVVAVFVKDLSRLSRNHVFLAEFMEKFCPTYQVDLIAVGDGYDSRKEQFVQTATRLRALFYECYSKDISEMLCEAKKKMVNMQLPDRHLDTDGNTKEYGEQNPKKQSAYEGFMRLF